MPGEAMPWRVDTARTARHMETGAWDPLRRHLLGVPQPDQVQSLPRSPQHIWPWPCLGQLSPRTLSGSPHETWPPSGHSAEQSFSAGWDRTWGEKPGIRMRLSKLRSIQAMSAAGRQGCEQTFTLQILGPSQVPSPALACVNLLSPRQRQVSGVAQSRALSQDTAWTKASCSA